MFRYSLLASDSACTSTSCLCSLKAFGASYFDLGVIGTVWSLAQASTPMLAGHLADRLNRAWIFSFSLGYQWVSNFHVDLLSLQLSDIVVLQFVGGIRLGVFWPNSGNDCYRFDANRQASERDRVGMV